MTGFILKLMLISPRFTALPNFFIVFTFPGAPCFPSSLVSPTIRDSWPVRAFFGLLDMYFCQAIWMGFFFVIEIMIVYFKVNTTLLDHLR